MSEPSEPGRDLERYAAEEVAAFMGTVAGMPSFQLRELIAAEIKLWRFKRLLRHGEQAKAMLDAKGLQPHQVPFRTLVPLIESASLEDDDELSGRWAALLANAAGGESEVPPSFPRVLRELEPVEARLLEQVFESVMAVAPQLRANVGLPKREFPELDDDEFEYHADNLARLRLADMRRDLAPHLLALTAFGRAFVRACRPPGTPDPPIQVQTAEHLRAATDRDG